MARGFGEPKCRCVPEKLEEVHGSQVWTSAENSVPCSPQTRKPNSRVYPKLLAVGAKDVFQSQTPWCVQASSGAHITIIGQIEVRTPRETMHFLRLKLTTAAGISFSINCRPLSFWHHLKFPKSDRGDSYAEERELKLWGCNSTIRLRATMMPQTLHQLERFQDADAKCSAKPPIVKISPSHIQQLMYLPCHFFSKMGFHTAVVLRDDYFIATKNSLFSILRAKFPLEVPEIPSPCACCMAKPTISNRIKFDPCSREFATFTSRRDYQLDSCCLTLTCFTLIAW